YNMLYIILLLQDHNYLISLCFHTRIVRFESCSSASSLAALSPGLLHTQNIYLSSLHAVNWGYLRSTAEGLRQTVLQQKDQILTDQRTIRELTGKLSECEKGLGGRSAAGLVRGRSRTDSNTSGVPEEGGMSGGPKRLADGGLAPEAPWRMEDLEEELERKVELLDKERKALRLETEKHRQEIDLGVDKLHHRISGLEEGVFGSSFPEGYRLSFPTRTNYMYAVVKHSIPTLWALTLCLWLRPAEGGIGTPLSYAVPAQPNELVLLQGLHTPTELLINDKVAQLPLNLSRGSWQHVCVSWSQKGGVWQAYQGGKLRGEGHALATGHHIRPGGVLILGQEQDSLGGGFDASQALVGELSQVGLWDRVLSSSQVASLARCGRVPQGSVAAWTENGVEVHGGATKDPGEPCSKHNRRSQ
uniref:Pentraxin (PTX) domain-containing protein n=1 Tax=Mola mola TaxID=94237 RepID=A0A3Q3VN21_MOLML